VEWWINYPEPNRPIYVALAIDLEGGDIARISRSLR
jgi:hypothetical protein